MRSASCFQPRWPKGAAKARPSLNLTRAAPSRATAPETAGPLARRRLAGARGALAHLNLHFVLAPLAKHGQLHGLAWLERGNGIQEGNRIGKGFVVERQHDIADP